MREIISDQFDKAVADLEVQNPDMNGYFVMVLVDGPFNTETETANTTASSRSSLSPNDLAFLMQSTGRLAVDHGIYYSISEVCDHFGLGTALRKLLGFTFLAGGAVALGLTFLIRAFQ